MPVSATLPSRHLPGPLANTAPQTSAAAPRRLELEYVLPLRWTDDTPLPELTGYLRWLAGQVPVTVVDGSPPEFFARHAAAWAGYVRHVPPDPHLTGANGKVLGVLTGLRLARHEHVVIADDDVRYDEQALRTLRRLLDRADLVRPQNYFDPLPWHAHWDTGRSLLNRAVGADYPGTLGVRRSTFQAMGGYDPDVLFENLELIRTVGAYGGRELTPPGLYVRRVPPATSHFLQQRIRQAYDDIAQPWRLMTFLAVVPALTAAAVTRRTGEVAAAAAGIVALAEYGRRRAGGRHVFPVTGSLLAPLWVLERGVCSWLALAQRVAFGGVGYAGGRLRTAAHSPRRLRASLRARAAEAAAEPAGR